MSAQYLLILAVMLGSLAATVPVFMALFFTGMLGLVWMVGIDAQIVIEVLYRSMDKFALIVILFFVLCGNIMTTGSIVRKLVDTANALVGWLPGGLAMAGILACGFFGAISLIVFDSSETASLKSVASILTFTVSTLLSS